MKTKVSYTNAPTDVEDALDRAVPVEDFLPSPAELVLKSRKKEKITISVDKQSLDLFKHYAQSHDAKYQSMMNGVLESYADKFLKTK